MLQAPLKISRIDRQQEDDRLAALLSTGILDTPPEAAYDTIARLAAEYFQADAALIGFADESRYWVKSSWGLSLRELPRENCVFEMVLAANAPVVIPNVGKHPESTRSRWLDKRFRSAFITSVPVRSADNLILGTLTIISSQFLSAITPDALRVLENLAGLVSNQLELRKLRSCLQRTDWSNPHAVSGAFPASVSKIWPGQKDLHRALEERQFVLHYQPEVDLSTRKIVGLEALIRWKHPQQGLISPMDFIPLAEESGLILPIGDWVLAEACRQIQKWSQENPDNLSLRIAVNLSARQFSREGLADHVGALLLQFGISSRQLGLEMTESSIIPNMRIAMDVLSNLRRLGVSLLVDDFGTGYSSLSYLHSFPFDVLKIDRSFVCRMTEGDQPLQIVHTIIELARVLGMDVVAEGIENRQQYNLLRQMGCRSGQGFLFARPMDAEAITQLLRLPGRILPDPNADETSHP